MGQQLKLSPDIAKASGRFPAGVLGDPKPIAQRYAHSTDLRQASLRRAEPQRASQPAEPSPAARQTASTRGSSASRTGLLTAGLVLAALIPNLILGALWLGLVDMPWSTPAAPRPVPAIVTAAVLTAPDRIEATAGEDVDFPIALDGTDGVPPRSVIAIRGLPPGSKFSDGRPYGDSEWNLRPDQIGDLDLALAPDVTGEFKLAIALIAPDDRVVAEAATLLAITPVPTAQAAAEESGAAAPDGGEAAAPAALSGTGRAAAELEPRPAPAEAATAPTDDATPAKAGPAEGGNAGLGSVQPSVYVNLRDGPASSAQVVGVIAKGAKLSVLDRKRGWVQVTDPATAKKGWIYSGNLAGEAKHRRKSAVRAEPEPKSESFWSRVGDWVSN